MPKLTRIYTGRGDQGTTSLSGGQRVSKHALRVQAYGTVDELNSYVGVARAYGLDGRLEAALKVIQNELLHLGADLSLLESDKERRPGPRIEEWHIIALERLMDALNEELGPLPNFVLPGGTPGAAHLHFARTVCRRAERLVVQLAEEEPVGPYVLQYLNRLSDALFVMARFENYANSVPESFWNSRI